jgi:uncharacterized membrane protein YkoI
MKPVRKVLAGTALGAAVLAGGALGATLFGTANAATSGSSTAAPSGSAAASTAPDDNDGDHGRGGGGPHQANGKTETPLTGDALTKATAAAKAAVAGATVDRAETDAEGAAYEVHMTKSDGSKVTVKLDSGFKVTQTVNGMG